MKKMNRSGSILESFGIKIKFDFWTVFNTFIFVAVTIPWRIFKGLFVFAQNPTWEQLRMIERVFCVPTLDFFMKESGATEALHEMVDEYYEKYHVAKHSGVEFVIRPYYKHNNAIYRGYSMTKAMSAFVMAVFYFLMYELIMGLVLLIGMIFTAIAGFFASMGHHTMSGVILGGSFSVAMYIIVSIYMAWLTLVSYRFLAHALREATAISPDELEDFVNNLLAYTLNKLEETNGVEIAQVIHTAVIESVVYKQLHTVDKDHLDAIENTLKIQK